MNGAEAALGRLVPPAALVAVTVPEQGVPVVSPPNPLVPVVHVVPMQAVEVVKVCTTTLPA